MSVRFRWLGYVCFEMVLPSGKVLVLDPYIDYSSTAPIKREEVTGADYIALTHGHYDHITDVGPLVREFGSKVICSHDVAEPLARLFELNAEELIRVTAGDTVTFDDLRVEARKGQHIDLGQVMSGLYERITGQQADADMSPAEVREAIQPRLSRAYGSELREMMDRVRAAGLEGGEQLTFVFQTGDNLRICVYSSGPYDHLREEVVDARANVFMAQLGGVDPEKAAEFAALSGADVVIPTHHDGGGARAMRDSAQAMAEHLAARSRAQFLDIVAGQWYEVGARVAPV